MHRKHHICVLIVLGVLLSVQGIGQDVQTPELILINRSDRKPSVVAIRRVNLIIEDRTSDGEAYERLEPHVELELYVGTPELNTQLNHMVQIHDTVFQVRGWGGDGTDQTALLLITEKEFEDLNDGGEILFRISHPVPRDEFKKLYKEGHPYTRSGLKVGKLDKKMIDLESTIEKCATWNPQRCPTF